MNFNMPPYFEGVAWEGVITGFVVEGLAVAVVAGTATDWVGLAAAGSVAAVVVKGVVDGEEVVLQPAIIKVQAKNSAIGINNFFMIASPCVLFALDPFPSA
jgi:hypothetical protein